MQTTASSKVQKIDSAIYYALLGFALSLSCSIAGASIFIAMLFLLLLVRIYLKHDGLFLFKHLPKGFIICVSALIVVSLLSGLLGAHPANSTKAVLNFYVVRLIPMAMVLLFIKDKRKLVAIMIAYFIGFTIDNIAEFYNWGFNQTSRWYHSYRAEGFIFCMNKGALFSGSVPFLALASLHYLKKGSRQMSAVAATTFLLGAVALILSGTRGAWLGGAITAVIVLFLYLDFRKFLVLVTVGAIVVGGIFVSSPKLMNRAKTITITDKSNASNYTRILLWHGATAMWKDNPVLGVGITNFHEVYIDKYRNPKVPRYLKNAHNNIFHYMAERGTLGGLAFLALWAYITIISIKGWRHHQNLAYLGMLAMYTGIMIQGLTECNFDTAVSARYMWTSFGVAFAWLGLSRKTDTQQEETI